MVADNCWEEYMWKVHHAIPIDPWQSTFQLLDVLIDDEFADDSQRTGFAARFLRAFRRKMSVRRSFASGKLRRVGSMLTVGDDSSDSWHQNVEMLISQGLKALSSENPRDQPEVVMDSGKSAGGQQDGAAENGPKSAEGGPVPADAKEGKSGDGPKSAADRGPVPTDAKPEEGPKSAADGPVPADAKSEDGPESAERGPVPADMDAKEGKSADGPKSAVDGPVPTDAKSEDGPKSGVNGPVPADAKEGKSADGSHQLDVAALAAIAKPSPNPKLAAAIAKSMETSNPAAIPNPYQDSLFAVRDLPDMTASVASTTSLLASVGIASNIVSGQFDARNTRTVKCTFSNVRSHKVLEDALAKLVGADGRNRTPDWKPDISNPLLRWSPKRGQRLWIVTEIMYANKIEVEDDVKKSGEASASVKKSEVTAAKENVDVEIGKDVMWTVKAGQEGMRFPFAFRMMRLDYEPNASLLLNSFLPQHLLLSRSRSISNPNPKPNPNHAFHSHLRSSSLSSSTSSSYFVTRNNE